MITDVNDLTSFKWGTITGLNPLAVKLDGDTVALALIPDTIVDPQELFAGDRVRVELSLRRVVIHGKSKGNAKGTTSQRNARFGVPVTDAEKAALANRVVRWTNTTLGWDEIYYAPTGTPGLTVAGILAGRPAGWYPVSGKLPHMYLKINTIGGISNNRFRFRNTPAYLAAAVADEVRGITVNDASGEITLPQVGTYEAAWNAAQGTASGAALVMGVALNSTTDTSAPAGSVYDVNGIFGGSEMPSSPTNYTFNISPAKLRVTTEAPTDIVTFWFGAGTGGTTVVDWGSRTSMKPSNYLRLDYIEPPFSAR